MGGRAWLTVGGAVLWLGCADADAPAPGAGENDAERRDSSEVTIEMVGRGTVSTELPEFAAAFTPEGDTLYFNRTPPDRSQLDLYMTWRVGDGWADPILFGPLAGQSAIDPFVSADGSRLYFSSDMSDGGRDQASFNIWFLERTPDGWAAPTILPEPISSDSSDVFNSFTSDGTMVFSSRRDGSRRIYLTRELGGSWSRPAPLVFGETVDGSNPMISPDGSFLVFSAPGPSGPPDLMVSCRVGDAWGTPIGLPAPINSEFTEFAPGIHGESLYFTSERPGVLGPQPDSVRPPGDLYRTDLRPVRGLCMQ